MPAAVTIELTPDVVVATLLIINIFYGFKMGIGVLIPYAFIVVQSPDLQTFGYYTLIFIVGNIISNSMRVGMGTTSG